MRSAAAMAACAPAFEHRAENKIVDRRPPRIGLGDGLLVEFRMERGWVIVIVPYRL